VFNGRHLILVGVIACAGLLSVHDGQRQIELGYKIGALEKDLRGVRVEIEMCRIKHQALQAPRTVMAKVAELRLPLQPATPVSPVAAPDAPRTPPREAVHSLGSPQGAHPSNLSTKQPPAHLPANPGKALASVKSRELGNGGGAGSAVLLDTRAATNVRH
jgi:hypothetical protein